MLRPPQKKKKHLHLGTHEAISLSIPCLANIFVIIRQVDLLLDDSMNVTPIFHRGNSEEVTLSHFL